MVTSLAEVARLSGVSTATVSHVLNGTRYVSPQTAQRVREVIDETGYRRNPFARALRKSTSDTIGFVVSDLSNPYAISMMKGIEAGTRKMAYTLVVSNSDDNPALERDSLDMLVANGVAGLIVAPTSNINEVTAERLSNLDIPVSLVDSQSPLALDQVRVASRTPSREVVGHLLDRGYHRTAVLSGPASNINNAERVQGWRDAYEELNLVVPENLLFHAGRGSKNARKAALEFMQSEDRPQAVFTTSNQMTLGFIEALGELGLSTPRDVALVAFDKPPFDSLVVPKLTCVVQPTRQIGKEAVRLVMERMVKPGGPARTVTLDPRIRHGGSCCDGVFDRQVV